MGRWKKPPAAGSKNPPAAVDKNPSSCSKMKSPFQLVTLEKSYAESSFPSESTQRKLSAKLGLTHQQLKGWFCRRRLKDLQKPLKDWQPIFPSSEMGNRQETDQEETDPHASDQEETDPHASDQEETGPNAADYEKDEEANHQEEEEEFEEKFYRGKRKHPRSHYKRDDYDNDLFPPPQVTVSFGSSSNLSRHSMASSRTRPSFSGTGVDDRQETNSHDVSHETVGNEEVEHQESGNEKTHKGKGKHPELSYGSKCSLPTVAVDVVNRNIDIEKQLNQLLSVVKEQQSNLPKLVKRCSAPVVELKTKMAELEKLVATLKQQQAEEKKTAERFKGAFEEEKALREKAEKELCEERSAWADLVLQLGKAKKQNEDMFNTASERFGKMRRVSGLSKDGSSSPPAASSG